MTQLLIFLSLISNALIIAQLSNMIAWSAQPITYIKNLIKLHHYPILDDLFNCPLCLSFWIALIFFNVNFIGVIITTLLAQLIEKLFR